MKKLALILPLVIAACGYSSRDNEMIGQVKKVLHVTPIICPNRYDVDVSLGVIKGGVGSMSTQDVWLTVDDPAVLQTLKQANESGAIVKVKYDVARLTFCTGDHLLTSAQVSP